MVKGVIDSYIKANDAKGYPTVVSMAKSSNQYDELVEYLLTARGIKKGHSVVETELLFAYAKTERGVWRGSRNLCRWRTCDVADWCFDEKLHAAAKILHTNVSTASAYGVPLRLALRTTRRRAPCCSGRRRLLPAHRNEPHSRGTHCFRAV